MTACPHDALFKAVFGDPVHAAAVLRAVLPAAIAAGLAWPSIERVPSSFVDDELRERHTDLLYAVRWVDGACEPAFVLFEHQSSPEPRMALRLARYTVRIWDRWCAARPADEELPVVLPVVLYHGAAPWPPARTLEDSYAAPADLRAALRELGMRLAYELDDVARTGDPALRARGLTPLATIAMVCLKHARAQVDLVALLHAWRDELRAALRGPGGGAALLVVMRYILEVNEPARLGAIRDLLSRASDGSQRVEETIMTIAQQLRQEGIKQGIEQGIQQGQRALLLRLLGHRFGEVSPAVTERVAGASLEELERWSVRILTAPTAEAVLAE